MFGCKLFSVGKAVENDDHTFKNKNLKNLVMAFINHLLVHVSNDVVPIYSVTIINNKIFDICMILVVATNFFVISHAG